MNKLRDILSKFVIESFKNPYKSPNNRNFSKKMTNLFSKRADILPIKAIPKIKKGKKVESLDLKVVTGDTLKELITLDVVTPEMYESVFKTKLKLIDESLELNEIKIDTVEENLKTISKIQQETTKSAKEMQENIDLATTAIDQNDTQTLNEIKNHMKELQNRIQKLENEIFIDSLTKVYNRKWLYDKELDDGLFKDDGVLVFIDLDKFKQINDTYGHLAGDKVLVLVTNLLVKLSNSNVIRFGGDEFIIFSYDNGSKEIEKELEIINNSFKTKSLKFQDKTFKISLSFGSVEFKKGDSFHDITQIVDEKMYEQKRKKRELESVR